MATDPQAEAPDAPEEIDALARPRGSNARGGLLNFWILRQAASLKVTVALMACAIFIILVGTLAQTDKDMWEVKRDFFEATFCYVEFNVLLPDPFWISLNPAADADTPSIPPNIPGGFYFPGGALIGALLALNLLAAHLVRFKVQARGQSMIVGLIGLAIGAGITALVIMGGHDQDGVQGVPMLEWSTLWLLMKLSLVALWFVSVYALFKLDRARVIEQWLLIGLSVGLAVLVTFLLIKGDDASLSDSSMRILWQLIQGTLCGVALLVGGVFLFKKRAGVVVIHMGVGLLMFSEFFVSMNAVEEQMAVFEKETVNFARDVRASELVFTDSSPADNNVETIVPEGHLAASLRESSRIKHADLPFDVEVLKYSKNSEVLDATRSADKDNNLATAGIGRFAIAEERRPSSGASSDGKVDYPSAYVRLYEKDTDNVVGVYMASVTLSDEVGYRDEISHGGKTFELSLRFRRSYKPYELTLLTAKRANYQGTSQARDFRSTVRLVDHQRNTTLEETEIWMNNPLRYAGETFYQSQMYPSKKGQVSVFQIVTNLGWMIPYVSCMIVAVGMFFHFGVALQRYLSRRATEGAMRSPLDFLGSNAGSPTHWVVTAGVVAVLAVGALMSMEKPASKKSINLAGFAALPVMYEGRVQPLDSLARNSLRVIAGREYFKVKESGKDVKHPAIRWFIDMITNAPEAADYQVFRIDNPDVQKIFKLTRREGHRYSVNDLLSKLQGLTDHAAKASELDNTQRTVAQRQILALMQRLKKYGELRSAFDPIPFPEKIDHAEMMKLQAGQQPSREAMAKMNAILLFKERAEEHDRRLAMEEPPLAIPLADEKWAAYSAAQHTGFLQEMVTGRDPNRFSQLFREILDAYRQGFTGVFNQKLSEYQAALETDTPTNLNSSMVNFESYFNRLAPFSDSMVMYLIAFALMLVGYLAVGASDNPRTSGRNFRLAAGINRFVFLLIIATFVIHTYGLYCRMIISGRPPVTNLYSSAIFIGWGCVVLGMVFEMMFRFGVGNLLASVTGFSSLLIASILAGSGEDTLKVLVAVLDTQFWLATHVVMVTLGYATTFLAGMVGLFYIICGIFTPALTSRVSRELTRIMYAVICFSIFFSFVGTVLGGLWADDSWGRFWGWDPKENGALMIVLWNALVLHARWGGMVKDRGLAALTLGGNIVTAWSWFGTNELGVGLHSYGFTDGVIKSLLYFWASQILFVALATLLPRKLWRSYRAEDQLARANVKPT